MSLFIRAIYSGHNFGDRARRFDPISKILQYSMDIDGEAGTISRPYHKPEDIEHLRYDIASIAHYLRRACNRACVIGVGAGKDIQCALLFGDKNILGIEVNPVFIDLLENRFRDVAGVNRSNVRLVVDEARSYLSRSTESFDLLQMSLIDTWAATAAGAFSLSENSLYTLEAWKLFLNRLSEDGVFTVTRWHSESELSETGRLVSLAVAALLETGVKKPRDHIALITADYTSTLLVCKTPFHDMDLWRLKRLCAGLQFKPVILPGEPVRQDVLETIIAATSGRRSQEASRPPAAKLRAAHERKSLLFQHASAAGGTFLFCIDQTQSAGPARYVRRICKRHCCR